MVRLFVAQDVVQPDGSLVFQPKQRARAFGVIVQGAAENDWHVAGIGRHVLVPGWPPVSQQIAGEDD